MSSDTEPPDLQAPLRMLRDATDRLLDQRAPLSKDRLDTLYRHIAGAVAEVLDSTRKQLDQGMAQMKTAGAQMGEESPDFARLFEMFDEGRQQIDAGLKLMAGTFFKSTDLKALESNQGALSLAETQIEDGLNRLEAALMLSEDPSLMGGPLVPTAAEIPTALDSLSECLDNLSSYLQDASPKKLRTALIHLDQSRALILRALEASGLSLAEDPEEED